MSKSTRSGSIKSSTRTDAAFLKLRVEELEKEVGELKKRLTDLRRAKNTTVLKKEKEYVSTGTSEHKRSNSGGKRVEEELQKQMKDLTLKHKQEIETLTEKHSQDLKTSLAKNNPKCDHERIIAKLKEDYNRLDAENKDLKVVNGELQTENIALRDKFEQLFTELSIKEAQWCEREEQLNLKLKMQWGEKYREWMEATEKKIEELQRANALLRSCVKPPPDD